MRVEPSIAHDMHVSFPKKERRDKRVPAVRLIPLLTKTPMVLFNACISSALRAHLTRLWLLTAMALVGTSVSAKDAGIEIDSFRIIEARSDHLILEIIGSYDGSVGPVFIQATTRSVDGSVRTVAKLPGGLTVGHKVRSTTRISGPTGLELQKTDVLHLKVVSMDGKTSHFSRTYAWPYVWPEMQIEHNDPNQDRTFDSLGAKAQEALLEALINDEFLLIDSLLEKWSAGERDHDGEWKVRTFTGAVKAFITRRQDSLQTIKAWRIHSPHSPGAAIAEAIYWSSSAWKVRGSRYTPDDDEYVMSIFRERMNRAERALLDSKAFASKNPVWYQTYLDLATATERNDQFLDELFDEGLRKFPDYLPLHVSMAKRWMPGPERSVDADRLLRAADLAMMATETTDGTSNYARFFWSLTYQYPPDIGINLDALLSRLTLNASLGDLVKRFPSAQNINVYAVFACRSGDKQMYLGVRPRLQRLLIPEVWPTNFSPDLCDRRFMLFT